MYAAVRIRGSVKVRKDIADTLEQMGLKKVNAMSIFNENPVNKGMILKAEHFVAWGEISQDLLMKLGVNGEKRGLGLKPAKGGLKAIKKRYPKGDLGYRGDKINELIKKMI
jgi:ribosomal protein L30/L7E